MAEDRDQKQRSGLTVFDGVLLVVGGLVAIWVAFAALHFVAGLVWFVIRTAVVVVAWLVLGVLHVVATLLWGVVQVAGLVALVLVVWWLFFRKSD